MENVEKYVGETSRYFRTKASISFSFLLFFLLTMKREMVAMFNDDRIETTMPVVLLLLLICKGRREMRKIGRLPTLSLPLRERDDGQRKKEKKKTERNVFRGSS